MRFGYVYFRRDTVAVCPSFFDSLMPFVGQRHLERWTLRTSSDLTRVHYCKALC